jgi:hypothetical protein
MRKAYAGDCGGGKESNQGLSLVRREVKKEKRILHRMRNQD